MRRVRLGARRYRRESALLLLVVLSAIVVGRYILEAQHFHFPWDQQPFEIAAEFSTAQAVAPGQDQAVRISGVRVGVITDARLQNGRAVVTMDIDPKYRSLLHTDATALLRPQTPLMDKFVELDIGSPSAPRMPVGFTIPVANTLPDIAPDQVNSVLDADTRDYLSLLIGGFSHGLRGRGADLKAILHRFAPTHRDLARVSSAISGRRRDLAQLVDSLNALSQELANHQNDLALGVSTAATTFTAIGSQQGNIASSLAQFPAALQATSAAMTQVHRLASVLGPASQQLRPVFADLAAASRHLTPFARDAAPVLATEIRPFVSASRPTVEQLQSPARSLAASTPNLSTSFQVLNQLLNMAGYNPNNGHQGPQNALHQEGFLFYAAWLLHNTISMYSNADANGPMRSVALDVSCDTLLHLLSQQVLGPVGATLAPVLADLRLCK